MLAVCSSPAKQDDAPARLRRGVGVSHALLYPPFRRRDVFVYLYAIFDTRLVSRGSHVR